MDAQGVFDKLKAKYGDKITALVTEKKDYKVGEPWIELGAAILPMAARFLHDDPDLAFDCPMNISAVDRGEKLEMVYHLFSMKHRHRIELKVAVPREDPVVPTVEQVWGGANWHEREAYDLMGIRFEGHSDLRRILLPDDWEGYPLRKDYAAPATYRGMPVAGKPLDVSEDQRQAWEGTEQVWEKPGEKKKA